MVTYDLYLAAMHFAVLYLAIILFSMLFGTFGRTTDKNRRYYLACVCGILFILMAFRGERMGSDTLTYISMFERVASVNNPFDYISTTHTEPGFVIYCWILSHLTNNPRILFVVSALIVVTSIGRFARKYISNLGIFFVLFIGTLQFDFFLSALRNALSVAIFLYAIDFLLERKWSRYFLLCSLALLFHNTALVYFVLYPLCSPRFIRKQHTLVFNILMIGAAFLSGFFFQALLRIFLNFFPKYNYYVGTEYFDGKVRIAVVLKIAICLLLIIVPKIVYKRPADDLLLDGFGRQVAMFNLLVMFVAINATAFMRIATVVNICTLMQFANEVNRMRRGSTNKILLISCALAAFFAYGVIVVVFRTPEWQTTYPINLSWLL